VIRAAKVRWVHPVSRESPDSKDTRVQLARRAQRAPPDKPVQQVLEAKLATLVRKATRVKPEISAQLVDKDWVAQLV
jgi:hypothetical protein